MYTFFWATLYLFCLEYLCGQHYILARTTALRCPRAADWVGL